ncbi:acyltransferase family protein [Pseudoflavonifractor phocaeensis]|uniref:acyltransferase family protein n=1 Tax=Pseudoflavonifractor phocaeensis TaxID=1870988 RepID=UPI00195CD8B8|nr:acyltransferase family protein [Pseudoflavonifractor phocaeensis]MBM6723845.1 acyltransferase family protein [Pseudoflavonifractor phocaeensis]
MREVREFQYDNLRCLLIALVVLGHLLEIAGEFPHKETLYTLIYSFHMPAFLFLSGMFARFDRGKFIFGMALPYLVLQTFYTSFVEKLGDSYVHMQFSTPHEMPSQLRMKI